MKKFLKSAMYVSLLMIAFSFTACQKENVFQPGADEQQTLTANSATANLVERTVSNDGSYDNIVDGSSCFDIRFPYHVKVNGIELMIGSRDDLHLIEEIFDAVDTDENLLDIIFPVTITLADYSEITVNSIDDIRELAAQCKEGGDDDDIECIDIVYPVTLFTFDTSLTETGSFVVESDKEMRRFFAGLGENDLISIDFPVTLKLYDGTEMTVNSNTELAAAIESAKQACDEDDDNDYNDDDFTQERLNNLLTECPWLVMNVIRDNVVQTEQYFEYLMAFSPDGKVTARLGLGNVINGTWSTHMTDNGAMIKLEFDTLVDFNLDWYVYEIEQGKIKLYSGEGNRIIMKNACGIVNGDPNTLGGILRECDWIIKKVKNNGDDINRLLGFQFSFEAENVITLSDGVTTSTGTWNITLNAENRMVMAITMGDEPGVSFEWLLSDLRDERLKFEIPGTGYELILERNCDNDVSDGDVMAIREMFRTGLWKVALFSQNEDPMTEGYAGYDFAFSENGQLTIYDGSQIEVGNGIWLVYRNSEGQLEMILTFGSDSNFYPLGNDYKLVEIDANRMELRHMNDSGGMDVLVFEKM